MNDPNKGRSFISVELLLMGVQLGKMETPGIKTRKVRREAWNVPYFFKKYRGMLLMPSGCNLKPR